MRVPPYLRRAQALPRVAVVLAGGVCCIGWAGVALAQRAQCLASVASGAPEPLAYRDRSERCEGALPRFVSNAKEIRLVGYIAGEAPRLGVSPAGISLTIVGSPPETVALRALSLTSTYRYQMDTVTLKVGSVFVWPMDLVTQASRSGGMDPRTLGVVACSNKCEDRPDTKYWPVAFSPTSSPGFSRVAVQLRAGVRAQHTRLKLAPVSGDTLSAQEVAGPTLLPDSVATIELPRGLATGTYRFTVEARDSALQPLGLLQGILYLPATQN